MKKFPAAMLLTAALSAGATAFAQAGTNPTGQVDPASAQTQNQKPAELKDIPAGHWASEAVKVAANCGIVRGFPDGTFRGNEPVSRYQAAAIVARLLDAIRNGECGIPKYATQADLQAAVTAVNTRIDNINTTGTPTLSAADLVALQNAIQELAADLAQLGVRVADLEDNAVSQDDLARVEEIATQARDLAEAAAAAAQEANDTATGALDTATGAQSTADEALAAAAAAQQTADDAAAAIEAAQQTADDALDAAANAQQAADDAMAVAEAAQQSADDALAAAAAAQQSADDAVAAAETAQSTADEALAAITAAQEAADAALAAAEVAQQTADDALALAQAAQPAGDYATNEDLASVAETASQAKDLAEAVAAALETASGGSIDLGAISDLQDQIEAASIAADTALAQSRELQDRYDELNGRVDDLESQLGELGATVEGQADSIAALNDLVVLLNQDTLSLQDRVTQLERGLADTTAAFDDVAANAASQEDLESLREFTTLLRRDQTALSDRVGELEARVGRVENRVTAVEGRVSALEANAFTISGTIGLSYRRSSVWREDGNSLAAFDFDIDRLALPNGGFNGGFSSGTGDGSVSTNARTFSDFAGGDGGTNGTRSVNANGQSGQLVRLEGRIAPSVTLNFGFKPRALIGATTNGLGNTFSITLNLALVTSTPFSGTSGGRDSVVNPATFSLSSLALAYEVGSAPLLIKFGVNVGFAFTKYGFANSGGVGDGIVASLDGAGLLPLNPKLSVVYQSRGGADGDFFYFTGAKGSLSLLPGLTGGVYYVVGGEDIITSALTRDTTTLYGLDFSGKLFGFLDLSGEWNASQFATATNATTVNRVATFVNAGVNFDPFTIGANWRYVDAGWSGNSSDLSNDGGPYADNQTGFGVTLGAKNLLGFLNLNGYFDSRSLPTGSAAPVGNGPGRPAGINFQGGLLSTSMDTNGATSTGSTDFGVVVGLNLVGFDLQGYFFNESEVAGSTAVYGRTDLGFSLANAGKLIPGVNVVFGFGSSSNSLVAADTRTTLYAYADTSFSLAGFTVAPKVYFATRDSNGGATFGTDDITQFGAAVTAGGDFLLGSKIALGVAFDTASHTVGASASSTFLFSAGLSWANGPLPGSTFGVSFSTRADIARSGTGFGPSFAAPVAIGSWGADGAGAAVLTGVTFNFDYYGLAFRYGIFNHTNINGAPVVTWGSRFSIGYSLKF